MPTLSPLEILTLALGAGFSPNGEEAVTVTAIALAESGGNPRAHNDNAKTRDDSYGLWQINMIGKIGPERRKDLGLIRNEELFDPATNARAARHVFKQQTFTAWSVFSNQRYKDHLGAVRQAATQLEPDLTIEELLDALESDRGQEALQAAVVRVLRTAVGPDDGNTPAGVYFKGLQDDVKDIKSKVNQLG